MRVLKYYVIFAVVGVTDIYWIILEDVIFAVVGVTDIYWIILEDDSSVVAFVILFSSLIILAKHTRGRDMQRSF